MGKLVAGIFFGGVVSTIACASSTPEGGSPAESAAATETPAPSSRPDVPTSTPTTAPSTAPTTAPSSALPSSAKLPPVDAKCSTDADCAATVLATEGSSKCCVGCGTSTAGTKAWVKAFEAACKPFVESNGIHCPALACVGGRTLTSCVAGVCKLKT